MSEAEQSVTSEGVRVTKSLDRDRFKTPAVVFEVASTRETEVIVGVSDSVPETVSIDDIGFHPEFGGEHWSIDGHRVTFEYHLDAGEEYTTVYGIRDVDDSDLEAIMDNELTVEVVTPADTGDDLDGIEDLLSGNESVVRDVLSGDRDGVAAADADEHAADPGEDAPPAADDDAAAPAGGDDGLEGIPPSPDDPLASSEPASDDTDEPDSLEPLAEQVGGSTGDEPAEDDLIAGEQDESGDDLIAGDAEETADEPIAGDRDTAEAEPAESPTEPAEREPGAPSSPESDAAAEAAPSGRDIAPGSVASALAAELESGDVDAADRERIRDALAADDEADSAQVPGHVEAKIEHLQTEMSDLAAYTAAMESFLDAYGDGESVLDDLEADLEAALGRLESVESTVEEFEARLDAVTEDIEAVATDVDQLDEHLQTTEQDLTAVEDRLDAVESATDDIPAVRTDLEEVQRQLDDAESALREDIRDLEADVAEGTADPERLSDVESRAGSIEDEVQALQDELDELRSFKEQLSSAFGSGEE